MNGDVCPIGSFVIARRADNQSQTYVARVDEILQVQGSIADLSGQADVVLLQTADVSHADDLYHMPNIKLLHHWYLANPKVLPNVSHF
jgi:hypothetical protein